jgi:hypothetical protein
MTTKITYTITVHVWCTLTRRWITGPVFYAQTNESSAVKPTQGIIHLFTTDSRENVSDDKINV